MRQSKIDRFIDGYCRNEGIVLLIDPKLRKDDGLCYPPLREIHLAKKYTSSRIKLAIFLHEVGHIAVDRHKKKPANIFECEMMSWQYAINTHKRFFGKFFSRT